MGLYRDVLKISPQVSLDQTVTPIDYIRHKPGKAIPADQTTQSFELFERVAGDRRFHGGYRRYAGEALPWQATPGEISKEVFQKFDKMVGKYRQENSLKPKELSLGLARAIFEWFLRPRSEGGFGMQKEVGGTERNFDKLLKDPRGDCSEHTFGLLQFFRRVGFRVRPEWVGRDLKGNSIEHVVVALEFGGKSYLMDGTRRQFDVSYTDHTPWTRAQLLGWYWQNRGNDAASSNPKQAELFYQRAIAIDPYNPHFHVSLGVLYLYHLKDAAQAETAFNAALKIAPGFSKAYQGLGDVCFEGKAFAKAAGHYRNAVTGDPDNVSARQRLVRSAIGLENKERAKQELASFRYFVQQRQDKIDLTEYAQLQTWISSQESIIATL
jgi:hypothetical protein